MNKLVILMMIFSHSIFAKNIREGGRTVGAGQVSEIISVKTKTTKDEVKSVLSSLLDISNEEYQERGFSLIGNLYFVYDGIDNDCDGADDDCNRSGVQDYNSSRSNTTTLILPEGDSDKDKIDEDNTNRRWLAMVLMDMISKVSEATNHNTTRSNRAAEFQQIGMKAWETVQEKNPIGEAFKDPKKCVQFREDFIKLVDEQLAGRKVSDQKRKVAKRMYERGMIRMEERVKIKMSHNIRVRELRATGQDRTSDSIKRVSESSGVSIDKVSAILSSTVSIVRNAVSYGYKVRIPSLGSVSSDTVVTGDISTEGDVGYLRETQSGDIPSVTVPPVMAYHPPKTTGRGVCVFGKCFCLSSGESDSGLAAKVKEKANKTKCSSHQKVQSSLDSLNKLISDAKRDASKLYDKDNKAAGTRVRKTMQELKSIAQDIRKEVQNKKND